MRNRGISKIYVIAGIVIGVVLLMVAIQIIMLNANPEEHRTPGDPALRMPTYDPVPEPAGSNSSQLEGGGSEKSSNPNP